MRKINLMAGIEKKRKVMVARQGSRRFMNKLDEMFDLQAKFFDKLVNLKKLRRDQAAQITWSKELLICMMDEMSETLNHLPWKHWKKYKSFYVDEVELKYELVDMLHFLLDLMLIWGMTAEECFSMYIAKNRENHNRQKRGY